MKVIKCIKQTNSQLKLIGVLIPVLWVFTSNGYSQSNHNDSMNQSELRNTLASFMNCLKRKDSIKFYNLFYEGPVAWVGAYKERSQKGRKNLYLGDFKKFYRSISEQGLDEEKFYNINIDEDGYVASVTFDYSFWSSGKKTNWGRESWGLVKADGKWKITSVIFSLEYEDIVPEPNRENKK